MEENRTEESRDLAVVSAVGGFMLGFVYPFAFGASLGQSIVIGALGGVALPKGTNWLRSHYP